MSKIIGFLLFLIAFFAFLASAYTFFNLWSASMLKKELPNTVFASCNCGMDCIKAVGIVLIVVCVLCVAVGIFSFRKNNNGSDSGSNSSW